MARLFKRKDQRLARNLDIFWSVKRDSLSQDEVAAKHGISQQRVSAIVRRMGVFVALAPSEEYEQIPQMGQLQYACRLWMARLEARRVKLVKAFDQSMQAVSSVQDFAEKRTGEATDPTKQASSVERQARSAKTKHGDWRLDRQIEGIDKQLQETRIFCYGRVWRGWNELEASGMAAAEEERKKRRKKGRKADGGGGSQPGVEDVAGSASSFPIPDSEFRISDDPLASWSVTAGCSVVDGSAADAVGADVGSTQYTVLSTQVEMPALETLVAAESAPTQAPPSTLAPPPSDLAPPPAAKPAKRVRPPAISKLTGKLIEAPALKTPEYLRMHGLDPADYNGGRPDLGGSTWITGADPREVLSRNVGAMNRDEYRQYLRDLINLEQQGVIRDETMVYWHPKHHEWRATEGLWSADGKLIPEPTVREG